MTVAPGSSEMERSDGGLTPEAAALAAQLRELFHGIGVTQARYAARVHNHRSVVCRYLNGERIPPWYFVYGLLAEATNRRGGTPPTVDVVAHLRALRDAALAASSAPGNRIMLLEEQLGDADAAAQRATARVEDLERALQALRHRVAELEVRNRELEAAVDEQASRHSREPVLRADGATAEHMMLLVEIARLTRDLEDAQHRRVDAEARCVELEQRLSLVRADFDPSDDELPSESEAESDDVRLGWFAAELEADDAARAAAALDSLPWDTAGRVLGRMMDPARIGATLDEMNPEQAARFLENYLNGASRAAAISEMAPAKAAKVLSLMSLTVAAFTIDDMLLSKALLVLDQMGQLKTAALLPRVDRALGAMIESIMAGTTPLPEPADEFTQTLEEFCVAEGWPQREPMVRRLLATVRQALKLGLLNEGDKRRTAAIVAERGLHNGEELRIVSNLILASLQERQPPRA